MGRFLVLSFSDWFSGPLFLALAHLSSMFMMLCLRNEPRGCSIKELDMKTWSLERWEIRLTKKADKGFWVTILRLRWQHG